MNPNHGEVGHFVFSLDTELAWGGLWEQPDSNRASEHRAPERGIIQRLLDVMDEYGVVATWAITGHLFYEKCEDCSVCPVMELKGKDRRFAQIFRTRDLAWYGSDVVDLSAFPECRP